MTCLFWPGLLIFSGVLARWLREEDGLSDRLKVWGYIWALMWSILGFIGMWFNVGFVLGWLFAVWFWVVGWGLRDIVRSKEGVWIVVVSLLVYVGLTWWFDHRTEVVEWWSKPFTPQKFHSIEPPPIPTPLSLQPQPKSQPMPPQPPSSQFYPHSLLPPQPKLTEGKAFLLLMLSLVVVCLVIWGMLRGLWRSVRRIFPNI